MRNEIINMDASIKARLKNIAKEYKKTFNLILQLYVQEKKWGQIFILDTRVKLGDKLNTI